MFFTLINPKRRRKVKQTNSYEMRYSWGYIGENEWKSTLNEISEKFFRIPQHYGSHCYKISLYFAKLLSVSSRASLRYFKRADFGCKATKEVVTFRRKFARCNAKLEFPLVWRGHSFMQAVAHYIVRERNIKLKTFLLNNVSGNSQDAIMIDIYRPRVTFGRESGFSCTVNF